MIPSQILAQSDPDAATVESKALPAQKTAKEDAPKSKRDGSKTNAEENTEAESNGEGVEKKGEAPAPTRPQGERPEGTRAPVQPKAVPKPIPVQAPSAVPASASKAATSPKTADAQANASTPVASDVQDDTEGEKKAAPPWAASSMNVSQSVSLISFDRSAELDYNPYYALTLGLAPHWRWHPKLYTSASLSFSREITQPDGRNRPDEIWLSDTKLTLGTTGWTIPVVDITVGGRVTSVFATSPASQAQTLTYGLDSGISINRKFSVLGGLGLGYGGSFRVNVHEFTTGELESPRIPTCRGQTCAELLGTGVRNTQYQQAHTANVSLTILSWLSVSTSLLESISAICIRKHPSMG